MKKIIILLILLLTAVKVYNLSQINYDDLAWEKNKILYLNLAGNILIMISLVLSYLRYSIKPE